MAKAPSGVAKFKRVERVIRDCVAQHRRLVEEAEAAAASTGRTQAERKALEDIAGLARRATDLIREANHRLIDVTPFA